MFKKIIVALLLVIYASPSFSQRIPSVTTVVELNCISGLDLLNSLKEYTEIPLIRGLSIRGSSTQAFVLYVNPMTKSWTLVEKTENNFYCILSAGESFEYVPEESRKELQDNYNKKTL